MALACRCVACGADVSDRYCPACGEAAGHHDYSLRHFAEEALETFAHLDGRVFSTFRSLVTRPGLLASNFLAGRRKSQMGPVQLFVVCNVIYFLMQPLTVFAPFTSTLGIQTTMRPWHRLASTMVASKVAARQTTTAEYTRVFDEAAHLQGKSLVILMVPLFACGAWALFGRSRRSYAEHLVFGFYIFAFVMLWMGISTLALTKPVLFGLRHRWSGDVIEMTTSAVIGLPFVAYLFAAARRTYGESRWRTACKTVLLSGWVLAVLTAYRFVLFFTSFYAT
jgi:Protein of unknown function (DUF3667)